MNRVRFRAAAFGILCLAGCSANNMNTLTQERAAAYTDVADSLMKVADEDSADDFLKNMLPRLKARIEANDKRIELWDKTTDEDNKKAMKRTTDAIAQIRAGTLEPHQDLFDSDHLFFAGQEIAASQKRCEKEQIRIAGIYRDLLAAGGSYPQLLKCTTAGKDTGALPERR